MFYVGKLEIPLLLLGSVRVAAATTMGIICLSGQRMFMHKGMLLAINLLTGELAEVRLTTARASVD